MDTEAGANPFWHALIIFSTQETDKGPVKVEDSIGFYSQASTTTNFFVKNLKKLLGFAINLQDGHGVLKQELMHTMNVDGLHGISFEVDKSKFETVKKSYADSMRKEQEAIAELDKELTEKGIPPNGDTRYSAEIEKAAKEKRKPRLKPFHFTVAPSFNGIDSSNSYTCKNRALELLSEHEVISEPLKEQIMCSRAKHTFPRFSWLFLPPIRLISTGKPIKYVTKKTKKTYYNHQWEKPGKPGNSLFWVTPVRTLKGSETTKDIPLEPIKHTLKRIKAVDTLLRRKIEASSGDKQQTLLLERQLTQVSHLNELFSNAHENQIPELLDKRLKLAEHTLDVAALSLAPERLNYSFIMRLYESASGHDALASTLALLISAAILLLAPPVGVALLIVSTASTALQLHGFYKEEKNFAKTKNDYKVALLPIAGLS
jgi:hypothetical protein